MPRVVHNALTDAAVKALAAKGKVGRIADGGGLYLHVTAPGQAKWSFRFMVAGKSREMGLGAARHVTKEGKPVSVVGLADARLAAKALRVKVDAGVDPLAEREVEETGRRAVEEGARAAALLVSPGRTFRAAFAGWLADHGPAMRTERQRVLVRGLMGRYVLPTIGDKPVATVTATDMADILRPIWRAKAETALRVRIRCEAVFAWAKAHGWRQADNPAVWEDNLKPLLGRQGGAARVRHHKAMHYRDLPVFMHRLQAENSTSALALRWVILTAARTSEALGATWDEIDMEAPGGPVLIVPGRRMKMGIRHRVPLGDAALAVLEAVSPLRSVEAVGGGFLFPGAAGSRGGRIAGGRDGAVSGGLSQMALLALLRRMKVSGECTTHGFRSTFRDWVSECTATPWAVAEAALAHKVGTDSERAYARSELLERRRLLMDQWAAHCLRPTAGVVTLNERRA